jgi:glutathione peroxidase-family protein
VAAALASPGDAPVSFDSLRGKTLTQVFVTCESLDVGFDNQITFVCTDGTVYRLFYEQDSGAEVYVEDISGSLADLIGSPLLVAEEVRCDNHLRSSRGRGRGQADSTTWTFYKLDTINGGVTIRWLGTSNGYYSERVNFARVAPSFYKEFFARPSRAMSRYQNARWQAGGVDCGAQLARSLKGNVTLVVNLPPRRASPSRYAELEALYDDYRRLGFMILGLRDLTRSFTSSQQHFADSFAATFPVSKTYFQVEAARYRDPMLTWLCGPASGLGGPITGPGEMFLIDRHGRLCARFRGDVAPSDPQVLAAVVRCTRRDGREPGIAGRALHVVMPQ